MKSHSPVELTILSRRGSVLRGHCEVTSRWRKIWKNGKKIFQHLTNNAQVGTDFRLWTHTCKHCRGFSFRWYPRNGPCGRGGWSCGQGTPWDSLKEKMGSKASPQHWRRPGQSLSTLPNQDELPRPEVQQGDGPERGMGQIMQQPRQTQTDLQRHAIMSIWKAICCFVLWNILWRVYNNPNPHMTCKEKNTAQI